MLRLAILTARKRLGTYVGAFLALFGSAVLVMAGGMLLESALQNHAPVDALCSGGRSRHGPSGRRPRPRRDPGRACAHQQRARAVVSLRCREYARRSPTMRFLPASVRTTCRPHGWSSAQLAPYRLVAGRPPADRERGRHHVPLPPWCARASDVNGARSDRHGRRDRARAFDAARGAADLPHGLRGRAPRRPSRPSRCDRNPRRSRPRPRARSRGCRRRRGPTGAVRVETPSRPPSRSGARS